METKILSVQFQPELAPELDLILLGAAMQEIADESRFCSNLSIDQGNDDGPYLNFNFNTTELFALWKEIEIKLYSHPDFSALKTASIVCAEGELGWDDFYLLWHFDGDVETDAIPLNS